MPVIDWKKVALFHYIRSAGLGSMDSEADFEIASYNSMDAKRLAACETKSGHIFLRILVQTLVQLDFSLKII